jgi:hypothetical protein
MQLCDVLLFRIIMQNFAPIQDVHLFHWRTVRVKIPPKDGSSGWKVEFRPTEIQLIDSQNAAFAIFAFLVSQLIQENTTQFAVPISKVSSGRLKKLEFKTYETFSIVHKVSEISFSY